MRFSNGFFGENEATLGTLRFSAMRREVFEENADGTPSEVVKERTYCLLYTSRTAAACLPQNTGEPAPDRQVVYAADRAVEQQDEP